jgi:zinc/manganese transport system ATP-binding protein
MKARAAAGQVKIGTPAPARSNQPMADAPVIRFDNAGVQLGGRFVWRHVDLDVRPGEFVAILGPNGAGKTTLIKTALGLIPMAEGSVSVLGQRVRRGNDKVGYLPQRRNFDADLRIRGIDLVGMGLDGARWGFPIPFLSGNTKSQRVAEVIRLVGADGYAGRTIGELSGGEQQRLLIAQALVSGARMLFLDEPLESLDLNNQQAISSLIQEICQKMQVTVLLVAHDVNPILPFLDRVIYVAQGQVVCGKPEDVIKTETLTRLYGAPVEVLRTGDGRLVVVGQHEPVSYHGHEAP